MSPKQRIAKYIKTHGSATSAQLAEHMQVTRQAINNHIRALLADGSVIKTGSTRSARYHAITSTQPIDVFSRNFALAGLDESDVYVQVARILNLKRLLRANVESIAHYAFTEMLNNAIDHSGAERCSVVARINNGRFEFEIRETGIGIFHSIAEKFDLDDEQTAMVELTKGKTTTMPEAHSGEGIFFTSKVADRFVLQSHKIELEWNRRFDDVFVSTPRFRNGTTVNFDIQTDSRLKLEAVFANYAPEKYNFEFQKTQVMVKLLQAEYVSRSEAKRLLLNLHKFREIQIDLKDVSRLGQGFADEVFRVFANGHSGIRIAAINATPNVAAIIRHAGGTIESNQTGGEL